MAFYNLTRSDRNSQSPSTLWRAWDNFAHDFDSFFEDFDKALGTNSRDSSERNKDLRAPTFSPAADVEENQNGYHLSFDMPGFKSDELSIDLNGRTLTVSGKRERSSKETESKLHRTEKFYGEYRRSITLPENVKADEIQANYDNGVLAISVPKAQLAASRKIEIGTGTRNQVKAVGDNQAQTQTH